MSTRTVYDTMVFLQWAALPEGRHHATIRALNEGTIRLCVSQELLDEVREVLSRPNVVARSPNITPDRLKQVLAVTLEMAEWVADVPRAFTWPQHPDDDHIFNLAIAAKAEFLVTWENRILKFASETTEDARQLRILAPQLEIITPKQLAERLKNGKEFPLHISLKAIEAPIMKTVELYKEAVILRDLPEARLSAGDVGTVVEIPNQPTGGPRGIMLEVFNVLGESLAVVTLPETDVEPLADDEVWHARRLIRTS